MRKNYFRNRNFRIGFILINILLILLVCSFIHLPYDVETMEITNKFHAPYSEHLLGTDQFGRDILSRVMKGLQNSMLVSASVVICGCAVGTIIGSLSGYYGGVVDEVIMKLVDVQMAFPGILLAMMLIAVFGNGTRNTILALAVMSVPRFTRIVRSGFLKYREQDFVKAEKTRGCSDARIMFIHILPNIRSEIIATASLSFASAVMSEAGLSYLGLGVQPPNPSLGIMLSEAQNYLLDHSWYVLIPTAIITILVMGFNLLGDGLQEINEGGK